MEKNNEVENKIRESHKNYGYTENNNEVKRTKGEWKVIDHPVFDNKIIAVRDNENSNSFRDRYYAICEMINIKGDAFTDNSECTKANAEFICKAVNGYDKLKSDNEVLLNALKGLYEFNLGKPDYLDTLLNNAESAILKAESK